MIKRPSFIAPLRPNRRPRSIWRECPTERLEAAVKKAWYEGSPYHRQGGARRRYPAASKCDTKWTQDLATAALRDGIRQGLVGPEIEWRGEFPRYVYYMDDAVVYQALLHNEVSGAYHAYPLNKDEWPVGLE